MYRKCRVATSLGGKALARQTGKRQRRVTQRVLRFFGYPGSRDFPDAPYQTPPKVAVAVTTYCRAHRRFCELLPLEHRGVEESLQARVSLEQILSLPELKANPFKERICRVFSTSPTRDSLSFEDFLDLLSVFSDTATPDIKSHYAFRIFDFDDDGTLNREDLSQLVNCLTGEGEDTRLSASEMKQLIDNILEESDIDRDGTINLSEFQHVISRSPDFASLIQAGEVQEVGPGPEPPEGCGASTALRSLR
ncbi:calcium and integrin-binding protein 1-like protein [Camelus ferus]|nr:calcium and integrin-binding protein 1-like protein [Camelus ferus]